MVTKVQISPAALAITIVLWLVSEANVAATNVMVFYEHLALWLLLISDCGNYQHSSYL